jgi:hypothetical protein
MRGCLFTLLLGAAAIALLVTIGLPQVYAGVVTGALTAAGLQSDDTTVQIRSDPPTDLLGFHADTVTVSATDATFRDMHIGSLDLELHDVAVLDRTAGAVEGTLSDVAVTLFDGTDVTLDEITIEGDADQVTASTVIQGGEVERMIADVAEARLGTRPTSVTLSRPDRITIDVGVDVEGTLDVNAAGDLILVLPGGVIPGDEVVLLEGGTDLPIRLTDVQVTKAGDLRLTGDLSIGILG